MNSKYLQPKKYFHYFIKKMKAFVSNLENGGERVDIVFQNPAFLDENERCHLKRYQFAATYLAPTDVVADLACGTGYGSVILATKAKTVLGIDIDKSVVASIQEKYKDITNLSFLSGDLRNISYIEKFDTIVSFETIEHFTEQEIVALLRLFYTALKPGGKLFISTPYMQKDDKQALRTGFHKTFFIDEAKVGSWLSATGFAAPDVYYQSYDWPAVSKADVVKDFMVCVTAKI